MTDFGAAISVKMFNPNWRLRAGRRLLLALSLVIGLCVPRSGGAVTVGVEVDASQTRGAFRNLLGVNRAPLFQSADRVTTFDVADLYQALGVSQVRTHDGAASVCATYTDDTVTWTNATTGSQTIPSCQATGGSGLPIVQWVANNAALVNDLSVYDFSATDSELDAIARAGAQVYLRIGESYNGVNILNDSDLPAYTSAAVNLYRHMRGSFGTIAAPVVPVAVEVWNEPDGGFWQGPDATFYALFNAIHDGVAGVDPTQLIGGPGFTQQVNDRYGSDSLTRNFVDNVTSARLGFFSAHYYGHCPQSPLKALGEWLTSLRSNLHSEGLADSLPLHVTEWNIGLGTQCGDSTYSGARMASWVGGALAVLQEHDSANVQMAHYYAGSALMALIAASGTNLQLNPGAWGFWAHRQLLEATRLTTSICLDGTCRNVVDTLQAGGNLVATSVSTADGTLMLLLANDSASTQAITVHLTGSNLGGRSIHVLSPSSSAPYVLTTTVNATGWRVADANAESAAWATVGNSSLGSTSADATGASFSTTVAAYGVQVLVIDPATPSATASPTPSSTPTPANPGPESPTTTASATPTPTPDPSPSSTPTATDDDRCPTAPASNCATPGKSSINLKYDSAHPRLSWRWSRGTAALSDFGDPPADATGYRLCLYDDDELKLEAAMAADDMCNGRSCWSSSATMLQYKNRDGNEAGITTLSLRAGTGKAAIRIKGKGANLGNPFPLNDESSVRVQLIRSSGEPSACWEAIFASPPTKNDSSGALSDKTP